MMNLPRWQRGGGRDFVFYHSYPDMRLGSEAQTADFLGILCGRFQWATMIVQEHGQRWLCASYNPRSTLIVPYSFKDVTIGQQVAQNADRPKLVFFRWAPQSGFAGTIISGTNPRYVSFQ
jgi:hypothetical protein